METKSSPWSVAISSSRETPAALARCIDAAITACGGHTAIIDVLVNGNPDLAMQLDKSVRPELSGDISVRIWSISAGDKAHAWNEYLHRIWPRGSPAFFIDGYAEVRPGALAALEQHLDNSADVLGATGVPTSGRSAGKLREQMLKSGGIHGNLYAICAEAMAGLREQGFKLPLGLYRTDPLIGAVLMFRLDPSAYRWEPRRVAVVPSAIWDVHGISELTIKNLRTQVKRMLRQAQGDLENYAVREHLAIQKLSPQDLPPTANSLINGWLASQPRQARVLFLKRPTCYYAARKLRQERDWSAAAIAPELVATWEAASERS
jgi:hypothetical protein